MLDRMFKKGNYLQNLQGQGRNVTAAANTGLELRGNQEIHQAGQLRLSVHLGNRAKLFRQCTSRGKKFMFLELRYT
jgi:hypothetical protein